MCLSSQLLNSSDKYWIFFTIGHFYSLPCVADFLLDVLTGCCRDEVRTCAANSLHKLSAIQTQPAIERPKYYLLRVVLAARLPYWVSSSSTRGARQVSNTNSDPHLWYGCSSIYFLIFAICEFLNNDSYMKIKIICLLEWQNGEIIVVLIFYTFRVSP